VLRGVWQTENSGCKSMLRDDKIDGKPPHTCSTHNHPFSHAPIQRHTPPARVLLTFKPPLLSSPAARADLKRMYSLFSRVPSTLDELRQAMAEYVKATGRELVSDQERLKVRWIVDWLA
jgi:hypothetical protein